MLFDVIHDPFAVFVLFQIWVTKTHDQSN